MLIGCASVPSQFLVDASFTPLEHEAIIEGAAHICVATDGAACIDVTQINLHPKPKSQSEALNMFPTIWKLEKGDVFYERFVTERAELIALAQKACRDAGYVNCWKAGIAGHSYEGSIILLTPTLGDVKENRQEWVQTTIHELGHELGLYHPKGNYEGEYAWGQRPCIDELTLLHLCEAGFCNGKEKTTCGDLQLFL